jgi:2-oxoglutarate ferredoxin oxidoreductase subunit alpha
VVTADQLEAGADFGRYLDRDGDGIAYRTWPGTHPSRGAFFTRGSSKDARAKYSEQAGDYVENMERLMRKWQSARGLVPAPVRRDAARPTRLGVIYFGSTAAAMDEAIGLLEQRDVVLDALRIRAFPFGDAVVDFVRTHDLVFVVEQNRDGQLRMLLINECELDPARLVRVVHYDGTPITARFIAEAIAAALPDARRRAA